MAPGTGMILMSLNLLNECDGWHLPYDRREEELGNRTETRNLDRGLGSILLKVEAFLAPLLSSLVFSIYEIL
jgi:hypothetical protein